MRCFFCGHLHRHQEYKRAFYPGTLFQKTFGEPLPKGFFQVNVKYKDNELDAQHEFIEVDPPFKLKTLKISHVDELKQS